MTQYVTQLFQAFPQLDLHATDYYDIGELDSTEQQGLLRWLKTHEWKVHEVGSNYVYADHPSYKPTIQTQTEKQLQSLEHKTYAHSTVAESIVASQGWSALDSYRMKILEDPLAYLMKGGSWVDAIETCEIYELLCRGGMEQIEKNRKAMEEEKVQWKAKIIQEHTSEREKNFARILKENKIQKMSGPCCWVLKRDEVDHTCWSHEHKNVDVENKIKSIVSSIQNYRQTLDKICDTYLETPNPILWTQGEQTIEMIDYLQTQLVLLNGQLWNKPHNCIWLHPGEEGWKEEWNRTFAWSTKEERSHKWKPFWHELKTKEAHNRKQQASCQKFEKVLEQKTQAPAPKITKLHTWAKPTPKNEEGWSTVGVKDNSAW